MSKNGHNRLSSHRYLCIACLYRVQCTRLMIHPVGIIILAGVFNRGSRFLGTLKTKEDRQIADVFNKRHEICFSLSLLWGSDLEPCEELTPPGLSSERGRRRRRAVWTVKVRIYLPPTALLLLLLSEPQWAFVLLHNRTEWSSSSSVTQKERRSLVFGSHV